MPKNAGQLVRCVKVSLLPPHTSFFPVSMCIFFVKEKHPMHRKRRKRGGSLIGGIAGHYSSWGVTWLPDKAPVMDKESASSFELKCVFV